MQLTTTYKVNSVLQDTEVSFLNFYIKDGDTSWTAHSFALSNVTIGATTINTELISTTDIDLSYVETDSSGFALSDVVTKSVYDSTAGTYATPTWTHYNSELFLQI